VEEGVAGGEEGRKSKKDRRRREETERLSGRSVIYRNRISD
jgi:hypothetical protein